jgi:hypothetical protein
MGLELGRMAANGDTRNGLLESEDWMSRLAEQTCIGSGIAKVAHESTISTMTLENCRGFAVE